MSRKPQQTKPVIKPQYMYCVDIVNNTIENPTGKDYIETEILVCESPEKLLTDAKNNDWVVEDGSEVVVYKLVPIGIIKRGGWSFNGVGDI